MRMSEAMSGGTVSIAVKPETANFHNDLSKAILGGSGSLTGIGKELGMKLLAGFAIVEIGKKIVEGITESVDIAKQQEQATVLLQKTVSNAGFAYEEFAPKVEAADKAGRAFGFTNLETTQALNQMTLGLKDPAKALEVLHVAQDLARAKGIDLSSAALLVTKAMEGQTRPLKALGIDLPIMAGNATAVAKAQDALTVAQTKVNDVLAKYPDAADSASKGHAAYVKATEAVSKAQEQLTLKQSAGDEILKALSTRLGGSAAAAADTFAGKQQAMQATVDNFKESIGNGLLKVLDELVKKFGGPIQDKLDGFASWMNGDGMASIQTGIDWVKKYKDVLGPAATAIGIATVAAWGFSIALDANPVSLIIMGIAALIAIVALLATNFGGVTGHIVDFMQQVAIFAEQVQLGIMGVFETLVNSVIGSINTMLTPLNTVLAALGQHPIQIGKVDFTSALDNSIADLTNNKFSAMVGLSAPNAAPGGGGKAPHAAAAGGTFSAVPGGHLVNVAEAGRAETVVDTATLQAAMSKRSGGDIYNIYEATSARATAMQVSRMNNSLASA